ncbi:hypothetical protein Q9189_007349 [Teloschistes chrysophthalmus]
MNKEYYLVWPAHWTRVTALSLIKSKWDTRVPGPVDVVHTTQYGWTPLHWAASYGHLDCVRLLLESGADPDSVSDQRVTPLDLALQADQSDVLDLLHKAGARPYQDTEVAAEQRIKDEGKDAKSESISPPDRDTSTPVVVSSIAEKLHLVYDKPLARTLFKGTAVGRFVYPGSIIGPTNNIYEVSHFLETSAASISVRRSKTRAMPKSIKVKADYQEFELSGRRQNSFAGTMTMHKDWTGGWKVRQNTEGNSKPYLLRTTPEWSKNREEDSRWMLEDGVLQARSGWDDATPWMCIELGVDGPMQDLIVTCWVVKLWSETASLQSAQSSK